MKRLNILNIGFALIVGLIYFTSCNDPFTTEYTRYDPTPVTKENVNLVYVPVIAYPELAILKTDTPTFVIDGAYIFKLDTITSTAENGFNLNNFDIDQDFGVITYDNTDASILPGKYFVSVSITNVSGVVIVDQASEIEVLDVPITLSVDNSTVTTGALEQGVMATVSYTDESPDGAITSVEYSLVPAVTGFSIDPSTGEISKTTEASSGVHELSIFAATNLGGKSFPNFVTITVGPPPTISYMQVDGVSALTKVTLSPWTAYTTQTPVLNDMVATQWDVIVPSGLDAGAISIAADGSFSVLAEQNVAVGDYSIGVRATNASGASFEFPDQFILHFETRWDEANLVVDEDFQDASGVAEFGSGFVSYYLADAVDQAKFIPSLQQSENAAKNKFWDVRLAKIVSTKNTPSVKLDAVLVLPIDLTTITNVKDLRVSFGHVLGFNADAINLYERSLAFTYTALNDGANIPADWSIVMAPDDTDWTTSVDWGVGNYYDDFINGYPASGVTETLTYLPSTSAYHELGGVDNTKTIYMCWRVTGATSDGKNSLFQFDDISVQASTAFAAVEE